MSVAPVKSHSNSKSSPDFDWRTSPLSEAERRLADLKRLYTSASAIVLDRQSRLPVQWRCWCQSHKKDVPKSVLAQCRGDIPDGRWVFKNDGDMDDAGHGTVVCSQSCYVVYSQNLSDRKYQQRLAVAGDEGGNLPAEAATK